MHGAGRAAAVRSPGSDVLDPASPRIAAGVYAGGARIAWWHREAGFGTDPEGWRAWLRPPEADDGEDYEPPDPDEHLLAEAIPPPWTVSSETPLSVW